MTLNIINLHFFLAIILKTEITTDNPLFKLLVLALKYGSNPPSKRRNFFIKYDETRLASSLSNG